MKKLAIKSIFAGIFISIGSLIYINNPNIIGAIFFSIGLLGVFWLDLNLFTGKVGFVNESNFSEIFLILLANIIGCLILFLYPESNKEIFLDKLNYPCYTILIKSILCGMLIYLAVREFKKGNYIATLIAVPAFILSGSEHCIADICYMILSREFTLQSINFIITVIIGNSLGSLLVSKLIDNI